MFRRAVMPGRPDEAVDRIETTDGRVVEFTTSDEVTSRSISQLQATETTPVVNPIMQHLTKALDNPTMVDLILAPHEIANDIQKLTYIKSRGTIDAVKADADSAMTLMILRMNRDVIRSLVQHTIGYDFPNGSPMRRSSLLSQRHSAPTTGSCRPPQLRFAAATATSCPRTNCSPSSVVWRCTSGPPSSD